MKSGLALNFLIVFCAGLVSAQPQKGMMELVLSGPVFQKYSDGEGSTIAPAATMGYFVNDKLELAGTFGLLSFSNNNDATGFTIGAQSAIHFSSKRKTWNYASLGITGFFGELYEIGEENQFQVKGELGIKHWPLPGGAVKLSGHVIQQFPNDIKQTIFGIDVGVLIRIR
jgi:hypothetical protein